MDDVPYTVRVRQTVCETKIFSVFKDTLVDEASDVIAPDYLVVIPKNRTQEGVTDVVVPFVGDKIGLVQVFRHAVGQTGWEVPRGFVDKDETSGLAALREVEEETGLLCLPEKLVDMGSVMPDPGILDARIQCFAASEVEPLVRNGEIQDSVSLAAYCRSIGNDATVRKGCLVRPLANG